MSGFGKATPRAWRKGLARAQRVTRDDVADLELEAERFRKLAPTLGFCGACGVSVDEPNGKLHDAACPYLPPERRQMPPGDVDAILAVTLAEDLACKRHDFRDGDVCSRCDAMREVGT